METKAPSDYQDLMAMSGLEETKAQLIEGIEQAKQEQALIDKSVKGFEMRADGLYKVSNDGAEMLCSSFKIIGDARTFESKSWSKVIELVNGDKKTERIVFKSGDLISRADEIVQEMINAGLQVESIAAPKGIKEFLLKYRTTNKVRLTDRTGYHSIAATGEQVFLLGSECIGQASESVIQMGLPNGAPSLKQAGSLEVWRNEVATLAQGQTRMTFAISTAFAATMLRPLGLEGGLAHIYGASSKGKSLLLKIASSVVGGPSADYVKLFRTSVNGLEGLCAASTDILLCMDELGQLPPEDTADAVYMIGNGAGKTRAGKDGAARVQKKWLCLALTNGEIPIAAHIKEGGKEVRAGHEVRALDIHAIANGEFGVFDFLPERFQDSFSFAKHLEKTIQGNYGQAIRPFINHTLAHGKELMPLFEQERAYLASVLPEKINSQVKRVIDRFALISLAGSLATELGLTGWGKDNARKCVTQLMLEWVSERNATEDSEHRKVIQAIQDFISKHEARFTAFNSDETGASDRMVTNRAGFMKLNGIGGVECWYFLGSVFEKEVLKGIPRNAAIAVLKDKKLLEGGKATTQITAIGKRQPRVIPVLDSIMSLGRE